MSLTVRPLCLAIAGSITSERCLLSSECSSLVLAHQPAIADRVSGQDRSQSAFHESPVVQMPSSIAVSRSEEEGRRRGI